jgi:hypothetical protein
MSVTNRAWQLSLLPLSVAVLLAADQPWKDKPVSDWNSADTKLILTNSPWAKTVKAALEPAQARPAARGPLAMPRRRVGYGYPGVGYPGGYPGGYPTTPPGGYPGGSYPTGGYPSGSYPTGNTNPNGNSPNSDPNAPPTLQRAPNNNNAQRPPELTLRWESADPVREAVMKARDTNAPTLEEGYYALAVYGVPTGMVDVESKALPGHLKAQATIHRDGQKDLKPTHVLVLERDKGPIFVYLFARSRNKNKPLITLEDKRLDFEAQIGRLKFGESFFLEDMVYKGKLEL